MGQLTQTTAEVQEILNKAGVVFIEFTFSDGYFRPASQTIFEDIDDALSAGKLVMGFAVDSGSKSGQNSFILTLVQYDPLTVSQYGASGYAAFSTVCANNYVIVSGATDTPGEWTTDKYELTPVTPSVS